MSEFKRIPEEDRESLFTISMNAYPGANFHTPDGRERFDKMFDGFQAGSATGFYGVYRDGELQGSMGLFDYTMNLRSAAVDIGGVGFVAVDLAHKKERVAFDLIQNFVRLYRERGATMTALYPFRPDFYYKMGYGPGTPQNEYRIATSTLPKGDKSKVAFVKADQRPLIEECYDRAWQKTHGLFKRLGYQWDQQFSRPELRKVAYFHEGQVQGYLFFAFVSNDPNNRLNNSLEVRELVYENREALAQLMAFLQSQADQVNRVIFHTQDEDFRFLFDDPRNHTEHMIPSVYHETNVQGTGLMYRVVDTPGVWRLLSNVHFDVADCTIRFNVADTFLPENDGSVLVRFRDGYPSLIENGEADIEVSLGVAEFSSLLMGTVRFSSLYLYKRVEIAQPDAVETIDRLFAVAKKPICLTAF
jgi:predicted acetyltransferase